MSPPVFDQGVDHSRRELRGYGPNPPHPQWPNGAKVCLSFVLNYEEGGENLAGGSDAHPTLNRDEHAEQFLTEGGAAATVPGAQRYGRNVGLESAFDFGSHRGFYRILELFKREGITFTSWSIGRAIELNPQVVAEMEEIGCEVASHSWRWIDYNGMSEDEERKHINATIDAIQKASPSGAAPVGWYTGRQSMQTRRLVYEEYGKRGLVLELYDNDAYDEDLPYYVKSPSPSMSKEPLLVLPYTYDTNDMKFGITPGFATGEQFGTYLRDALDVLLEEGERGIPKMMTVGMHCRISGRPGRFKGLQDFVRYASQLQRSGKVWIANRKDVAEHWRRVYPVEG